MTDTGPVPAFDDPRDAAAFWYARERSGRMSDADREAFAVWLQQAPLHAREYALLDDVWRDTLAVPAERLRALAREPAAAPARRRLANWPAIAMAGGAALVIGLAAIPLLHSADPSYNAELSSGHGERRQVALSDDSVLELNTDTKASVRFYPDRREVDLASGEITFSVKPDADRPFIVRTGDAQVRVTGTRFNVRSNSGATEVAVLSGSVEVKPSGWRFWQREQLVPGQGLSASASGLSAAQAVDTATLTAWHQGRIVFNNTPLSAAIAEMNRYAPYSIRLSGAGLEKVRVAGALSIDQPASFLELLPRIAPVRIESEGDHRYVVRPR
ncbi:FecR domain-containing protein [Achromobacter seleniivolatilans]|uniref:FecR domain-containing protein n=1 Tax=Achromobacter seleniivolatilans TaxID=3047478 RepID=A0ABY9M6V6_9BURK|nr:FecR domain-containing protein [Achromobacter sp. R39]WMD22700.1 FecR domain-containing protein [Achromobacter sp. R39]